MTVTAVDDDPFTRAAVRRDRWGRPYIKTPGGKEKPYTRCTTLAGCLEDTYNLNRWVQRQVAVGLARRADLVIAAAAHYDDKTELDRICDAAAEAARSSSKATIGTALHRFTERLDRGEDVTDVPLEVAADLAAYTTATAGFRWQHIEAITVNDALQVAGTPDRVGVAPGGTAPVIADLKGLALSTPIPTPSGWTTMGALTVGDEVFDAFGRPCRVTAKSATKHLGTYVVRFDDGSSIVCDPEHIWWTKVASREDEPTAKPVGAVLDTLRSKYGQAQHLVPVAGALDLPHVDLPIDPYLLGCWLGDGHRRDGCITKTDDLFAILASDGHEFGVRQLQRPGKEHIATRTVVGLHAALRNAGILGHKAIPETYLRASAAQRLRLLQGLMDTDGTWNTARRTAVFVSTDKALAEQVYELATTLGQRVHLAAVAHHGFGLDVTAYHVEFTPVDLNPFRLPRKADQAAASVKRTTHARRRVIVAIEPGPDVPTACIAVDSPTRTYLCGESMIATHNTGSVEFGMGKIAMQLAVYAHSELYDPATGDRRPHGADLTRGVVIHLPAGEGRCELLEVDLVAGWEAVQLAVDVRAWRARKGLAQPFTPAPRDVGIHTAADLARAIDGCQTVTQLRALWRRCEPLFDAALTARARHRAEALTGH